MGRFLGSHAGGELDRPDLNKCPDCGCFFDDDYCPLCGKLCPEEMKAGNRKAVKPQKERNSNAGRVTFIPWYHSWWFIILSFFLLSPLIALILLLTSPHKKAYKIIAIVLVVVWVLIIIFTQVIPIIKSLNNDMLVDSSMTMEEYAAAATELSPEDYYRTPDSYYEKEVSTTLRVVNKLSVYTSDILYEYNTTAYYLCEDINNTNIQILLRDCLLDGSQNFLTGDVVTVYGRAAGEVEIQTADLDEYDLPCINMAYVTIKK